MGETLPQLGQRFPHMGEQLPYMGESFPYIGEEFPYMGRSFPCLGEVFPHMGQSFPQIGEKLPHVGRSLPLVGERLPLHPELLRRQDSSIYTGWEGAPSLPEGRAFGPMSLEAGGTPALPGGAPAELRGQGAWVPLAQYSSLDQIPSIHTVVPGGTTYSLCP